MIPNILYNILRNNSSNNSNNTDNNSNNNPDNPDNPNNDSNNPNNNPDNNDQNNNYSINNPNSNPNTITNNNLEDNTRSRNIHLYDSNQLITSPPTVTSNQSIFNNIRFGSPVCILRAPSDLDIPSTSSANTDENSSEQPPLSAILLPPNIPRNTSSSFNEPVEIAKTNDKPTGGIFSDKYPLHVLPVEGNNNHLFVNRISYNTPTNAYYENGILSNKYLKKWNEGAYQLDNIEIKVEYDWMKTYLARLPTDERMNDDGEISWKFDYRIGSYVINSLKIRLSFGTFDNSASVKWFIKSLPTMKNQNPDWQSIQFDPYAEYRHEVNVVKDVTQFVKNEYGFILKAHLSGGESTEIIWQKTQLFRQDWSRVLVRGIDVEDDNTFGFDVNVELKPDIIVNPLPELSESFVLNDESTSDFVIHYKFTTGDNQGTSSSSSSDKESKESRVFHVHSAVLSKRSDYFNALLESRMIESQNKSLTLTDADISYDSLEVILNYLYTGTIPNIKSYDEWITLLHYAARFLIPTLIQNCEKVLKGYYLNHDNLDEIKAIACESGAEQLLQCCEYFELPEIN